MRRARLSVLCAGLLLFTSALLAAPAAGAYPVGTQAQLTVDRTDPYVGDTIEIGGFGFHPDESVRLTIGGVQVGTARTDARGAFDPPARVPDLPGARVVTGTGASGAADDVASVRITIQARGVAAVSTTRVRTGGLAFTGAQISAFVGLGLVLVAAGVVAVRLGRRRRPSAVS